MRPALEPALEAAAEALAAAAVALVAAAAVAQVAAPDRRMEVQAAMVAVTRLAAARRPEVKLRPLFNRPPLPARRHRRNNGRSSASATPVVARWEANRYKITLPDGKEVKGGLNAGTARHDQIQSGVSRLTLVEIEDARWSVATVEAHQQVELIVATSGLDAGDSVKLEIFRLYRERSSEVVATLQAAIDASGDVRANWTPVALQSPDDSFVFKATVGGIWRKSGTLAVQHEVQSLDWSTSQAQEGESVTLRANTSGVPDGERVTIVIYEKRWRKAKDLEARRIDVTIQGGSLTTTWTARPATTADERGKVDHVEFYFTIETNKLRRTSGLLLVKLHKGNTP